MSDATVFVSIAFAIVWMQRQKRWSFFFKAAEGSVAIQTGGTSTTSATGTATSGGSDTATQGTSTGSVSTPNPQSTTTVPGSQFLP